MNSGMNVCTRKHAYRLWGWWLLIIRELSLSIQMIPIGVLHLQHTQKGEGRLSQAAHFAWFSRIGNQGMDCQWRGPGSISQSSVRPIDFPTPRYHSDSSSTKALCPSQIIRSKEPLSWDKVASASAAPHTLPLSPSLRPLATASRPKRLGNAKHFAPSEGDAYSTNDYVLRTCIWIYNHSSKSSYKSIAPKKVEQRLQLLKSCGLHWLQRLLVFILGEGLFWFTHCSK